MISELGGESCSVGAGTVGDAFGVVWSSASASGESGVEEGSGELMTGSKGDGIRADSNTSQATE